ncbi:MAG: sigma 54-interacting transcriptional regulator [Desulfobacterales bacterium]|nr:sigma 54-interacting transcriptional regulator [Desulfobacterales bacterium]
MKKTDISQFFEHCAHALIATDGNGDLLYINQRAKNLLKLKDRIQTGAPIQDMLPVTGKVIMDAIRDDRPYFGHEVEGKDANLIVSINLVKDDDKVTGAICSFVDLEEFKAVAHKLDFIAMMDKKFETVFDASYDGFWLADGDGKVIKINRSSEKILGLKRSEVIGKKVRDVVEQGLYDNYMTDEIIRTKKKVSQLQTAKLTGKRILCTGIPVLDKKGNVDMVVINERDLSQLIQTQQELEEVRQEKDRYKEELKALLMADLKENQIVAENPKMQQTMQTAVKFGQIGVSDILIQGESGTGKGLTAKFIHNSGERSAQPFIQINCAAIPENILEAELFGYDKGAFTGAKETGKPGLIELAHKGTLFLDEIGELAPAGQAKLLKYLDDKEVMRIGGTTSKKVDCILIAATNQDLEQMVEDGRFRADLLFRLNSLSITLPPLRERPEDLFELTYQFLKANNEKFKSEKTINPLTIGMMQTYSFPGNVRELKNIIKKGVIMSESNAIDRVVIECIGKEFVEGINNTLADEENIKTLDDITSAYEKELIKNALKTYKSTRELAAYLGISQPTIVRKLKKHGLSTQ